MTTQTLTRALRAKKPAVIKEGGKPRYVVLDWNTYADWQEAMEEWEDIARFNEALSDPKNQKLIPLAEIKRKFRLY